jgi:hypothetical protein
MRMPTVRSGATPEPQKGAAF